jgi:hypothetical protein
MAGNPLTLPRTLVLMSALFAVLFACVSISATWWRINATITSSDYSGLNSGQRSYVNFGLFKVKYYSDLSVDSDVIVDGSSKYSSLNPEPTNIQDAAAPIIALLAFQIAVASLFSTAMSLSFTKYRTIFQRRWLQMLLTVLAVVVFISSIVSLGLINFFPSAVQDDYSLLFSASDATYLPSFDCGSDFTIAGLQFSGQIPSCTSVWATSTFSLTSDTINVDLTLSLNTGAGWWWNVAGCFCCGSLCLFFIPGRNDLFLESVLPPEVEKKNELQELNKESDRSEDNMEEVQIDNAEPIQTEA